jgi:hypothetical protein
MPKTQRAQIAFAAQQRQKWNREIDHQTNNNIRHYANSSEEAFVEE